MTKPTEVVAVEMNTIFGNHPLASVSSVGHRMREQGEINVGNVRGEIQDVIAFDFFEKVQGLCQVDVNKGEWDTFKMFSCGNKSLSEILSMYIYQNLSCSFQTDSTSEGVILSSPLE